MVNKPLYCLHKKQDAKEKNSADALTEQFHFQ